MNTRVCTRSECQTTAGCQCDNPYRRQAAHETRILQLETLLGKAHSMLKHGAGSHLAHAHMLNEIEKALGWMTEVDAQSFIRRKTAELQSH